VIKKRKQRKGLERNTRISCERTALVIGSEFRNFNPTRLFSVAEIRAAEQNRREKIKPLRRPLSV
jgi:hypothetical protein